MKLLIINQPPNNRGDESAHRALIRSLLKYNSNIQIRVIFVDKPKNWYIDPYVVKDERVKYIYLNSFFKANKIGVVALKKKWREYLWDFHPFTRHIRTQYKWADVVVCAPGGICMGGFQDWNHLYMLKWAKHCHRPLAYFGRSFGPFPIETDNERLFKEISLEMLNYFSFLSIRDKVTERLADELKIPYISTVDTAFLDSPEVKIPYELQLTLNNKQYMVFVPNYLLWHPNYKGKFELSELVDFYCQMVHEIWSYNSKLSIVMLPQTFGNGNMVDDIHLFRLIAEQLNDNRVIVIPDCYSSDIQQSIIQKAQLVIGARYHSIVFAINQGVPFIALSYEHKIEGLLDTLNKKDCMIDFTNTMLSFDNKMLCLTALKRMISLVKPDIIARDKAKNIAMNGFKKFLEKFNI